MATNMVAHSKIESWLKAGMEAAKAGRKLEAQELLLKVVKADESQLNGWLWLSAVVDTLEDREICLENVLVLEPNLTEAQRGLEWVQEKLGRDQHPLAIADTTEDVPQPKPNQAADSRVAEEDILTGKFRCVYCAACTKPDDKRCSACGQKLWISFPRKEQPSWLYHYFLIGEGLMTLGIIGLAILFFISISGFIADAPNTALSNQALGIALALLLVGAAVWSYVGLWKRWRIIYYLLVLRMIWEIGGLIFYLFLAAFVVESSNVLYALGALLFIFAIRLLMMFVLHDDFSHDTVRLRLEYSRGAMSALTYQHAGYDYARRKMWALSALHLRQAASMMSASLEPQLALTVAYINLKQYKLAEGVLKQVETFTFVNPKVHELKSIVRRQLDRVPS